jgi:type IVB pilus formation R64 PilN family outer membrane protein
MKVMRTNKFIAGVLASTFLAGCSVEQRVNTKVDADIAEASSQASSAAAPGRAANTSPIKVRNDVFVGASAVRNEHGEPLPAKFESAKGVTLVRTTPVSLRDIASALTDITKIPVIVAAQHMPSAAAAQAPQQAQSQMSQGGPLPGMANGPIPEGFPLGQALSALGNSGAPGGPQNAAAQLAASSSISDIGGNSNSMPLNYSGKLSGLLNMLASNFNITWSYNGGKIVIQSVVTRSYDIPALPIIASLSFDLTSKSEASSSESGGGASSNSGQAATTKSATDIYKDLQGAIATLAGPNRSSIDSMTGVVTVTADPATADRVGGYIKELNQRLAKQIAISVKVWNVALNDQEDFDLDVKAIFTEAGKYGLNVGTGVASSGIVPAATGGAAGLGWALLDTSSKWNGSNALVQALSKRGDVSVVTTASVTTVNGVPVPLQVGSLRDYVKKVTTTVTDQGSQTQIEPGSVTAGFNLHLVPRVDRSGDLLLQYGINISELTGSQDGFDTFQTGGQTVQLRRMNQRNFIQQARIPNGNTLVLAGFEQVRSSANKQGLGPSQIPFLGGSSKVAMQREIVVIAITPTILDLSAKN